MFLFSTQISPKISKTRDRVRDTGTGILIRKIRKSRVNPSLFGILKYNIFNKNFGPGNKNPDPVSFLVIYNNAGMRAY